MKYPIVVKKGPLALIKSLVVAEILIAFLLFFISSLADYGQLYPQTIFSKLIRYDYLLISAASLLQLMATLIVFLRWHNRYYEIKQKEIVSVEGIISTSRRSILLKNIQSVDYNQGPLEKVMKCGTVVVRDSTSQISIRLRNIENAGIYADIIKNLLDQNSLPVTDKTKRLSILDLILEGESHYLEFKQTFRWDVRQNNISKTLEKTVMKTVAGFLNSDGGKLIIGVSDNKTIFGLEADYKTLAKTNRDGFENHFNNLFNSLLGVKGRQFVTMTFDSVEGKDVCLIEVLPSKTPVYLNSNNVEEFYIRTGNMCSPLTISQAQDYIKTRWK